MASASRLTPLTRSDSTSSQYEAQSYSSRMAGVSRSSSFSSTSSAFSRRGSMSAAANSEPVIRNGFVIPKITLTPPDDKPRRSEPLPWQDFTSKSSLYVPVKTEDIGWEEGGLWWHGRFEYREVSLYGGEDDHVVGKYRGGPEGYAYSEIWDQRGFNYQPPRKNHEPAPQKPSPPSKSRSASAQSTSATPSTTSSASKRSSSGRGSIDPTEESSKRSSATRLNDGAREEVDTRGANHRADKVKLSCSAPTAPTSSPVSDSLPPSMASSRRNSDAGSIISSAASSRRTSDSAYAVDTAATSPCESPRRSSLFQGKDADLLESPIENAAPFDQLEKALLALKADKVSSGADRTDLPPRKSGAQVRLEHGKSLTLSDDGPSATRHWPKGRGVAKLAERPISGANGSSTRAPSAPSPLNSYSAQKRRLSATAIIDEQDLGYSC